MEFILIQNGVRKWDRVAPHISSLKNRNVLDVGCGSGYHMWRMLGEGANNVIGIDPTQLFLIQFHAIKQFISKSSAPSDNIHFLPMGIEDMQPSFRHCVFYGCTLPP